MKTRFSAYAPYVLAALAGILLIAPQLIFPLSLPEGEFRHVSFSEIDQERFYFGRVREAYDGHIGLRNVFSADYKDKPILHFGLVEVTFGVLGRAAGLHIDTLMILVKLCLGILVFVAIYQLSFAMTRSRWVATASAAVVVFGLDAFFRPWLIPRVYFDPAHTMFAFYSRPVQPTGGSIFLFGTAAALFHYRDSGKTSSWIAFVALLAASFYVYIFTWTFLLAFLGLVLLMFLWQRDYRFARDVGVAVAIALATASYLFYELWLAAQDVDYADLTARYGGLGNRYPILGVVAPACALAALFYRLDARRLVLPLYWTPLVVLNQQIITGRTLHTGHYHWYYHEPLFVMLVLALGYQVLQKRERLNRWIFGSLVAAAFLLGAVQQYTAYHRFHDRYEDRQSLGEVYAWLDGNTPKDSVVLAEELEYLVGYTHNNSYLNLPWVLVPQERLIEDLFVRKAFYEDREELFPDTKAAKAEVAMEVFAGHYHENCEIVEEKRLDISYACYDDTRLDPIFDRYRRWDRRHALDLVSKHRLDYVLMSKPVTNPLLQDQEVVFENDDYAVYRWHDEVQPLSSLQEGSWSAVDRSCYVPLCRLHSRPRG